jgi:hypothetical protein
MRVSFKGLAAAIPLVLAAEFGALGGAGAAPGAAVPSQVAAAGFGLARAAAPAAARTSGRSSLDCLTSAIYYEARSESDEGQRAVAQVVLNRVRHPNYPKSVCGVVYQGSIRSTGCQFTFTCDGSLSRRPDADGWARARRLAAEALDGRGYAPIGNATHYHTKAVSPYWAPSLARLGSLGAHIFYASGGRARGSLPAESPRPHPFFQRAERAVVEADESPSASSVAPRKAVVVIHRGTGGSNEPEAAEAPIPAEAESFGVKVHRGSRITG